VGGILFPVRFGQSLTLDALKETGVRRHHSACFSRREVSPERPLLTGYSINFWNDALPPRQTSEGGSIQSAFGPRELSPFQGEPLSRMFTGLKPHSVKIIVWRFDG
jgi:hypothetical protein